MISPDGYVHYWGANNLKLDFERLVTKLANLFNEQNVILLIVFIGVIDSEPIGPHEVLLIRKSYHKSGTVIFFLDQVRQSSQDLKNI